MAGRRQAIIWTNAGIVLIVPVGMNLSKILVDILTFSLKNVFGPFQFSNVLNVFA